MHSNKVSIIIGLIIIAINIFLLTIYFQKQWKYTFNFVKSLYEEIKKGSVKSTAVSQGAHASTPLRKRGYLLSLLGKDSQWCRKSNVPCALISCIPLKNSMVVRSGIPRIVYNRLTVAYS